ncbi:MAG: hypothetical protein KDD25_01585 [Bdellovibrionales bacterium]|nr:hypothetical protein [Bdellovibrionales bacterium]
MSKFLFALASLFVFQAHALTTSDLEVFRYEVRFTNPDCSDYYYNGDVRDQKGRKLDKKPSSYCTSSDGRRAGKNPNSPIRKVMDWVNDRDTKDITLLTFSLSNSEFIKGICEAAQRSVDVQVVMDDGTDPASTDDLIKKLKTCNEGKGKPIRVTLRGGGRGLGIHHNKLLLINSNQKDQPLKLAYGSANFSSGLVLHHENWSFVEVQKNSYFAQKHLCLKDGVLEAGGDRASFTKFINDCVEGIRYEEESDISFKISPVEGNEEMKLIQGALKKAKFVDLAAHRFSNTDLLKGLHSFIQSENPSHLRMTFDDDMFWAVKTKKGFGDQDSNEARIVGGFLNDGVQVHFAQTEHRQHLLHHNKYIIFKDSLNEAFAVHTGAGNLTGAAFRNNFENFYFITRRDIIDQYQKQYDRFFDEVATSSDEMPNTAEPDLRKN